jgi:hypothetical protein
MSDCNIEEEEFGFCKEHMPMRKCRDCGEVKPLTEYYFYKRKLKNGIKYTFHRPDCKTCCWMSKRKRELDNPKEHKERLDKYHQRDEYKLSKRLSERKRRESGKFKEWQINNKEKLKEYNELRRHKNHDITNEEWESCKAYFNHECAYCGMTEESHKELYGQQLHKEHVNHEGLGDLSNCVPACKICNTSKRTSSLEEWYLEQKFYTYERYEKIQQWLTNDYKSYINELNNLQ